MKVFVKAFVLKIREKTQMPNNRELFKYILT